MLVDDWIADALEEDHFNRVVQELNAISKAIDAYYEWSSMSDARERAIETVWRAAETFRHRCLHS